VLGVGDWKGFLDRLGADTLKQLMPGRRLLSEPLDYS
jgi:hypothetical protein